MDERLARINGSGNASITINGSGALAIAGLWVSALLLVIASAMAFVCWQQSDRLSDRVDMLEAKLFAAESAIRQLRKSP